MSYIRCNIDHLVLHLSLWEVVQDLHSTRVHSNEDQIGFVQIGEYIGFYVDRRS